MSKRRNGMPRFSDQSAMLAINELREPVRMAVASICWWDNVINVDMPLTFKAMQPELRPRIYPTTAQLIEALIKIGFTPAMAKVRIVDENQLVKEKAASRMAMRKIRLKRKANKR